MSDEQDRELLEQERRRFRMADDSYERLGRRRDRKRRNRMIASGVLALVIAAAGGTGAVLAFRDAGGEPRPGASSPRPNPSPSVPAPTPTSSPGTSARAFPSQPSGPIQAVAKDDVWYVQPDGTLVHDTGNGDPKVFEFGTEILGVQFIDPEHGWAVGTKSLLRTSDGMIWHQLSAVTTDSPAFRTVQFLTPDLGWGIRGSIGDASQLVKTTDGGETWQAVDSSTHPDSICFPDPNTGWAASGRTIFRTANGGQTWSSTTLDLTDNEEPWSATLACVSGEEAWVLLKDGGAAGHLAHVLFQTSDGGSTWTPVLQEGGTSPIGQRSDVYASTDPYPGQMTVTGAEPRGLAFVTWCPACGNSVSLLRSDDGGGTWNRLEIAAPDKGGEPQGVSFVDPDRGWVLLTVRTGSGPKAEVVTIVGSDVALSTLG